MHKYDSNTELGNYATTTMHATMIFGDRQLFAYYWSPLLLSTFICGFLKVQPPVIHLTNPRVLTPSILGKS
jgi:hypothetical protein